MKFEWRTILSLSLKHRDFSVCFCLPRCAQANAFFLFTTDSTQFHDSFSLTSEVNKNSHAFLPIFFSYLLYRRLIAFIFTLVCRKCISYSFLKVSKCCAYERDPMLTKPSNYRYCNSCMKQKKTVTLFRSIRSL